MLVEGFYRDKLGLINHYYNSNKNNNCNNNKNYKNIITLTYFYLYI